MCETWMGYKRWQTVSGSRDDMTHLSACIHDKNEIQRPHPCFRDQDQATRVDYCGDCPTCRLVVIYTFFMFFRLMTAIFDFRLIPRQRSVSSLVCPCCLTQKTWVFRSKYMGYLVGISFPSCLQGMQDRYWYFRFGGCHLQFALPVSMCNVLDCNWISGPKNVAIAFDTVLLSCLQSETVVFPVRRPPSTFCVFRFDRTTFL